MSYKKAIVEMCKSCIYDPYQPGTWRQQIKDCTGSTCPLFHYRPGSDKSKIQRPKRKLTPEHIKRLQQGRRKRNANTSS